MERNLRNLEKDRDDLAKVEQIEDAVERPSVTSGVTERRSTLLYCKMANSVEQAGDLPRVSKRNLRATPNPRDS